LAGNWPEGFHLLCGVNTSARRTLLTGKRPHAVGAAGAMLFGGAAMAVLWPVDGKSGQ
jgi:hypothetical protein